MNISDLISLRLNNHLLAGTDLQTSQEIVSWMGAIQAQEYNMAKWGIGNRLNVTHSMLDEALNKGDIIRTHILRPTWHFVTREDISWMLPLSVPRIKSGLASSDKLLGLDDALIKKASIVIRKALNKEHLTRQELREHLAAAGIKLDKEGRVLNHIMLHAEQDIVCSGRLKGNKQTYRLLEELTSFDHFNKDESLYKLAYKYFRSHGPATLQDFVWWSGLTTADARRSIELIKDEFLFEKIESQLYIFPKSISNRIPHNNIHLLPAFDEYLVSYRDKKEILQPHHHKKVITSNGIFQPFIMNKGEIIGTWKKVPCKNGYRVDTNYFEKTSKTIEKEVEKVIKNFYLFLEQV